jgi:hypothetical protein
MPSNMEIDGKGMKIGDGRLETENRRHETEDR